MTKWGKYTIGVCRVLGRTEGELSIYLRGSGKASQRKRYFTWGLNNEQRLGKEERGKCNQLCNLGNIPLVFGGIKIMEEEEEQLIKCQRLPLSTSKQTLFNLKQKKVNNHLICKRCILFKLKTNSFLDSLNASQTSWIKSLM